MNACGRVDQHRCTNGAHDPFPVCAHCGAPDVIRGDGAMTLVCERCLRALGRIAGDPFSVNDRHRERLLASSLDVLDLMLGDWRWTSTWPGARDGSLVRGGRA